MGFQLILGINDSQAKKTLVSIVIAALLINFSLYITQVVVDMSNIASYQIYGLINSKTHTNLAGVEIKQIGAGFLQETSVERLREFEYEVLGNGIEVIFLSFVVAFVLSLVGFVFAAGAFLMLTRFFYLFALMIFSPVMFLGFILPNFTSYSKKWWGTLFNQAFLGPAYLFMIYISLRVVQTAEPQSITTFTGYLLFLFIMAGFAWMSLVVAKNMGAVGASTTINLGQGIGNSMRKMAGGATVGLAAAGLRSSVGRGASAIADSESLKDTASRRGLKGWAARRALNVSRKGADATFDARKIAGVGSKLGIGEGRQGGYTTIKAEVLEKEKKFAASLGEVKDDDTRVSRYKMDVDAHDEAIKGEKENLQQLRRQMATATPEQQQVLRGKIEAKRAEIEDIEDKKKKAEENLSAEKQRRQLGERANVPADFSLREKGIKKAEENITNLEVAHAKAEKDKDEESKKQLSQQLAAAKKQLALDKKHKATQDRKSYVNANEAEKAAIDTENLKKALKSDLIEYQKAAEEDKDKIATELQAKQLKLKELEAKTNQLAGGYATTVENTGWVKNFFTGRDKPINKNAADELRKEYRKKVKGEDKKS